MMTCPRYDHPSIPDGHVIFSGRFKLVPFSHNHGSGNIPKFSYLLKQIRDIYFGIRNVMSDFLQLFGGSTGVYLM